MNKALLQKDVQAFIRGYKEPLSKLAFKGSPFFEISTQELLEQIDGFRRTEKKLPIWHATEGIIYPPKLNLEQTSSEQTARYKSQLVSGATLADLTGGLGIDSYYFSKKFQKVFYFERNAALATLAEHNFEQLGASKISISVGDSLSLLNGNTFDVIYIDPARRDDRKGKVFRLSDCEPDVTAELSNLLDHCTTLLIKTSPMLDLTEGLRELEKVQEIHIVAVQNEVKEVLWVLGKNPQPLKVHTINFGTSNDQRFTFLWDEHPEVHYGNPQAFLYEPNAALMKSGGMNHLTQSFPVYKLSSNAQLFTSESLMEFPGRRFHIHEVRPYSKHCLRDFKKKKAHLTTRDFPETVAQLRKKWQVLEGGDDYLFFTTLKDGSKVVLVTEKIL